ncbi:MAG: DEAD/DEAH box helicase [Methylacidiphilales bacterium]|nr:DEAD/DEAH box helicase [Candidatus Methylacidiphilales bacterium]
MSFQNLGLSDEVVHGVQSMGFMDPTPIQLRAFPIVLGGKDLIGASQTGTGKTAAFGLPLLSILKAHAPGPRVLILEPTRELAAQVETAFRDYSRFSDLRTTVVYGGVGYGQQLKELKAGTDVLVATPGRLIDHLEQGNVKLSQIKHLVLDEADRMLDMGFMPDVRKIIDLCPRDRQTLLFSATMPPEIARLTEWALREPERIEIGRQSTPATTITHALYPVAAVQKYDLLVELLKKTNFDSVLIFVRTKHAADRIAAQLKNSNHSVAVLHSNRSQNERLEALEGFRNGKYEVMVATDIASRGIDVAGISHVINYDVPQHTEDYVHRIGRTGRAQAVGDAFTLMTAEEGPDVAAIERFIGQTIPRVKLENFPYVYSLALDDKARHVVGKAGNIRGGRAGKGYSFGVRRR